MGRRVTAVPGRRWCIGRHKMGVLCAVAGMWVALDMAPRVRPAVKTLSSATGRQCQADGCPLCALAGWRSPRWTSVGRRVTTKTQMPDRAYVRARSITPRERRKSWPGALTPVPLLGGWRGRIRTFGLLIQNQAPYRLATRQWNRLGMIPDPGHRSLAGGDGGRRHDCRTGRGGAAGSRLHRRQQAAQRGITICGFEPLGGCCNTVHSPGHPLLPSRP